MGLTHVYIVTGASPISAPNGLVCLKAACLSGSPGGHSLGERCYGEEGRVWKEGEGVIRVRLVGQEVSTEAMRERRGGRREERHKPSS